MILKVTFNCIYITNQYGVLGMYLLYSLHIFIILLSLVLLVNKLIVMWYQYMIFVSLELYSLLQCIYFKHW
jgi:hypothetical protein